MACLSISTSTLANSKSAGQLSSVQYLVKAIVLHRRRISPTTTAQGKFKYTSKLDFRALTLLVGHEEEQLVLIYFCYYCDIILGNIPYNINIYL